MMELFPPPYICLFSSAGSFPLPVQSFYSSIGIFPPPVFYHLSFLQPFPFSQHLSALLYFFLSFLFALCRYLPLKRSPFSWFNPLVLVVYIFILILLPFFSIKVPVNESSPFPLSFSFSEQFVSRPPKIQEVTFSVFPFLGLGGCFPRIFFTYRFLPPPLGNKPRKLFPSPSLLLRFPVRCRGVVFFCLIGQGWSLFPGFQRLTLFMPVVRKLFSF